MGKRKSRPSEPVVPTLGELAGPAKRARRTKSLGGIEQLSTVEVDQIAKSAIASASTTASRTTDAEKTESKVWEAVALKEELLTPTKKPRKSRKKAIAEEHGADGTTGEGKPAHETPATASATRKRKPKASTADGDNDGTPGTTPRRSSRPRKPVTPAVDRDLDDEADDGTPRKRRRRTKTDEPVVYVIPPVERLQTTFRGRLGYACLNTILRSHKPEPVFCSRTCRLDTIAQKGIEFAKELGLKNAEDLGRMIQWNEDNKIRFMRVSSDMFPFASHSIHGYSLSYASEPLARAGALAKKYGHRLTMHPGQFTQLGSPKPGVVDASVRELEYQSQMLDLLGVGKEGVMVLHMGGVYGDKPSTIKRFKKNWRERLTDRVKERVVLENDELCYNVEELLPVSEELGVPIVLDWHHDWINPSSQTAVELLPRINAVWQRKGIPPKQHLSEPRPGAVSVVEKRAHADRCQRIPEGVPEGTDLMIEAKDKEQAVFHLWRIYGLEEPVWENLRPPAEVQELPTKGRKSNKIKKKKMGTDSEHEEVVLTEPDKEGDERALVDASQLNPDENGDGEESELTELEEDEQDEDGKDCA